MRYKIGMRAWLEAVADKSLPSLVSDAEGKVAAEFKGIYRILSGNRQDSATNALFGSYQSTGYNGTAAEPKPAFLES